MFNLFIKIILINGLSLIVVLLALYGAARFGVSDKVPIPSIIIYLVLLSITALKSFERNPRFKYRAHKKENDGSKITVSILVSCYNSNGVEIKSSSIPLLDYTENERPDGIKHNHVSRNGSAVFDFHFDIPRNKKEEFSKLKKTAITVRYSPYVSENSIYQHVLAFTI